MDAARPSMQPWRSRRALDKKQQEQQQQQQPPSSSTPGPSSSQQQGRGQDAGARKAPQGSRPDRLKPPPALRSTGVPLELLASPSRGLDAGSGADLTQTSTQEAYRVHISERIVKAAESHGRLNAAALFPWPVPGQQASAVAAAAATGRPMMESLTDVLLLVRRLREGCVAAKRNDKFAIDVYALSTLLSLLVSDGIQLSSSLPRLVDLLLSTKPSEGTFSATSSDLRNLFKAGPSDDAWLSQAVEPPHLLSLHLVWHSTTGGLVERIGGRSRSKPTLPSKTLAWYDGLCRVQAHITQPPSSGSKSIELATAIHDCLTRRRPLALRRLLLDNSRSGTLTLWHRALLVEAVEAMRGHVWYALQRAYKQLPFEAGLLPSVPTVQDGSAQDDWLERMLLLDTKLFPPTQDELRLHLESSGKSAEKWDDGDDSQDTIIRRHRLATFFSSVDTPSALLTKCRDLFAVTATVNESKS